jgi:cysteinyl-tRNA synthetase
VLPEALAMLSRLYEAREVAESMGGSEAPEQVIQALGADARTAHELGVSFPARFYEAMDSDFNTAKALGYLFELARAVNRLGNSPKARKRGGPVVAPALRAFALMKEALGLLATPTRDFHEEVKSKCLRALGVDRTEVESLLSERSDARRNKDWTRADAIRAELDARHIVVMDTPEGVEWRIRLQVRAGEE